MVFLVVLGSIRLGLIKGGVFDLKKLKLGLGLGLGLHVIFIYKNCLPRLNFVDFFHLIFINFLSF